MTASREETRFLEQRRAAVGESRVVRGLDSVEVRPQAKGDPVWRLRLYFLPQRPLGLGPGSFRVVGPTGEVDPDLQVTRISVAPETPGALDVFVRVTDAERVRRLRSDASVYRMRIDAPGLDRFFREAPFRFDGGVAQEATGALTSGELPAPPDIDYLAKDYDSFRRVMLERMGAYVPEWTERNPADVGVAVVEVLAYCADYLSYYQDAVATEAYLDTARKRGSVRRHLRLVGHLLHEGCNSRVWVQFGVSGSRPVDLAAGTVVLTRAGDLPTVLLDGSNQLAVALEQGSLVFETMHAARLRPRLDRMPVHRWGVANYALPRGATSVALEGHFDELQAGDVLILEQLAAPGETPDPRLRHPVRLRSKPRLSTDALGSTAITELEFFDEDALPFVLQVSGGRSGAAAGALAVARGNIVLADHGRTFEEELPPVVVGETYRPQLSLVDVTRSQPLDSRAVREPAANAISQRPERAVPQVTLFEVAGENDEVLGEPWRARIDLLESPAFVNEFVAETDEDGRVQLRFGDGRQGRRPLPGTRFVAVYRVGSGTGGHIGHDAIAHIVGATGLPVSRVSNPLPAQGAKAREPLERARLVAPRAFRKTENCVTAEDLSRLAESLPGVLHAVTESRWTGSWQTYFLYVQRAGARAVTPEFERRVRSFLEPRLLAGADLEIRTGAPLPLEVRLRGVVEPRVSVEAVQAALLESFGSHFDDGRGYFHPDNFTFGQAVFLDGVLDHAMRISGVVSIEAEVFRPWGAAPEVNRVCSSVEPGSFERVSLENRPSEPWLGILTVALEAGS